MKGLTWSRSRPESKPCRQMPSSDPVRGFGDLYEMDERIFTVELTPSTKAFYQQAGEVSNLDPEYVRLFGRRIRTMMPENEPAGPRRLRLARSRRAHRVKCCVKYLENFSTSPELRLATARESLAFVNACPAFCQQDMETILHILGSVCVVKYPRVKDPTEVHLFFLSAMYRRQQNQKLLWQLRTTPVDSPNDDILAGHLVLLAEV